MQLCNDSILFLQLAYVPVFGERIHSERFLAGGPPSTSLTLSVGYSMLDAWGQAYFLLASSTALIRLTHIELVSCDLL